jgi:exodeoxyribonuclease VII large subunit
VSPVRSDDDKKSAQLSFLDESPVEAGAATAKKRTSSAPAPVAATDPEGTPLRQPREAEPEATVLSVTQLVRAARFAVETRFADVRVEGEISGLRISGPGHIYFTLKDREAQLDCAMFAREAARLKFRPEDGLSIVCRGRLTIYEGRGKFQMTVSEMIPSGAGALALAFAQLKARLEKEGLFDQARKRKLPFLPRRIGIVTSRTGAVIRDIIKVAHRRGAVPLLVSPAAVQGPEAVPQLVRALELLWTVPDVDVIIVARGGGSMEDLWAFNEEKVARAIVASPVPVVSAVGHETDFTIADFVADLRAATPSAAAELCVPDFDTLRETLQNGHQRLRRAQTAELTRARHALDRLRMAIEDPRRLIDRYRQRLDDLAGNAGTEIRRALRARKEALSLCERRLLAAHPQRRFAEQRRELSSLEKRLGDAVSSNLRLRRRAIEAAGTKLGALSPLGVLDRGYSLTRTENGKLVTREDEVVVGQRIRITVREGTLHAAIADRDKTP